MPTIIPTGCLGVDLLVKNYPQERERIVKHAIDERRRQLASYSELRGLISFHPIHTTKLVLLSGLVSFILAFLLAQFAQLADWYKKLSEWKFSLALPVVGEKVLDIGSRVPTSTTFEIGAKLPSWSVGECFWFAVAVMVVLLILQAVQAAIRWRDAMRLKQGEHELQQELTYLQSL
jgi:hypothetical protein